jgi:hypothetical protein
MYGVTTTVAAPVEMYDGMHAEMTRRNGPSVDGLLVHVGRATADGFEVVEVWESKDHYDRAMAEIVVPLVRELAGARPEPLMEQAVEPFEVHGLVIPRGDILV